MPWIFMVDFSDVNIVGEKLRCKPIDSNHVDKFNEMSSTISTSLI